jgi:2-polyprenyl-3-methyl-5-hydroxy-6-metoxy-1,4-benzoquinol methylase
MKNSSKKYFENTFRWSLSPAKDISLAINSLKIWSEFQKFISDNKTIIDLGCGAGMLLYQVQKIAKEYNNCRVIGFDFTEEAILLAKKICLGAEFKRGNFMNTQFPANTFDVIISSMAIEHVDDEKLLAEISKIIKPGGALLLTTVMKTSRGWYYLKNDKGESVLDLTHLREYRDADEIVLKLGKFGFSVVSLETPMMKFSLLDFLLIRLGALLRRRYFLEVASKSLIVKLRKVLKIPIPGYFAIELIAIKSVGV